MDLNLLTATAAARAITSGEITAEELIRGCLARIDQREPTVRAWASLDPGKALSEARERDRSFARHGAVSLLHGIPVGIKDMVDTADLPTQHNSPIYRGHRPGQDAACVAVLRAAGAIILGKTETVEFAAGGRKAPTTNPHDRSRTPGGSSSGSAAAVADFQVPLAFGTQTGGSLIRPASFCGAAAIKPSYRLLPTVGVKCFSWTLDTVGLFAAGVNDLAHGLSAMTGRPELLPGAPMAGPRIGVVMQEFAGEPEAASEEALRIARRAAEKAGASIRALKLPEIVAEAWRIHPTVQNFEAHQAFAWEYCDNYDAMPPLLRGRLDESRGITPGAYDEAREISRRARGALAEIFGDFDVLLTFSAPGAAPKGLDWTGDPRFNRLWTLMGVPCVNIPAYVAEDGLPVGVQVIAPFGDDAGALAAARFVEEALAR